MASLDSLPPDQRAVLQLVLQRGRTYDEIAAMLAIDRAGVRQRALSALDALGPQTGVPAERRGLITDYLLGQLPARVSATTREQLGDSPSDRAWARVVASELTTIAANPLPEIPVEPTRRGEPEEPEDVESPEAEPKASAAEPAVVAAGPAAGAPPARDEPSATGGRPERPRGPRSSRRGGAILLGLALVVIVVAVVLVAMSGGGKKASATTSIASTPTTTPPSGSSTGSTTTPQVLRQINLSSPAAPQSKTSGLADVLKQGNIDGIAIVAQNVTPNTKHDAYAVWLYNSPTDSHLLGYVNPGVGTNGRLSTAGPLPSNASHYTQLIVTLETQSNPRVPGKIVLQGAFSLG